MRRLTYYTFISIILYLYIQGVIVYKRLRIIIIMRIIIVNRIPAFIVHINLSLLYKSLIDNIHNKTQLQRLQRQHYKNVSIMQLNS